MLNDEFERLFKAEEETCKQAGLKPNYYNVIIKCILKQNKWDIVYSIFLTFIAESMTFFYSYTVLGIIDFVKNGSVDDMQTGLKRVSLFVGCMFVSLICRNRYITHGTRVGLIIRRTLVATLFRKVVKLSMKSIVITNSGKLISLISSDLFLVEKGISTIPVLFSSPLIVLFGAFFMQDIIGWQKTLIVYGCWFANITAQYFSSKAYKRNKAKDSKLNDERLKLLTDMVVGCRTIKCYGWEKFYIDNINKVREAQSRVVIKVNILQTLAHSFYQNNGILVFSILMIYDWYQGKPFKNSEVVSSFSMVFLLFFSLNLIVYFSFTNLQNFLAVIERLGGVFELEEKEEVPDESESEPCVKVMEASFSWGFKVKEDQS